MTARYSVRGADVVVDDEPTLELPVVVVRTTTTGSPAPAPNAAPWSPTARPVPPPWLGRLDSWLDDASTRATSLRDLGGERVASAARAAAAGAWALVLWTLGAALASLGWCLRLLRRLAPVIAVVAVFVVGARSVPWAAAERLVRSVVPAPGGPGSDSPEQDDTGPSSSDSDSDEAAPSPTYPAMVPYDGVDPGMTRDSVEIDRPGYEYEYEDPAYLGD